VSARHDVHLADYQQRFGEIPRQELLELMGATEINGEQNRMLSVSRSPSRSCCAQTRWSADRPPRATSR
jgi:hypothetical protein